MRTGPQGPGGQAAPMLAGARSQGQRGCALGRGDALLQFSLVSSQGLSVCTQSLLGRLSGARLRSEGPSPLWAASAVRAPGDAHSPAPPGPPRLRPRKTLVSQRRSREQELVTEAPREEAGGDERPLREKVMPSGKSSRVAFLGLLVPRFFSGETLCPSPVKARDELTRLQVSEQTDAERGDTRRRRAEGLWTRTPRALVCAHPAVKPDARTPTVRRHRRVAGLRSSTLASYGFCPNVSLQTGATPGAADGSLRACAWAAGAGRCAATSPQPPVIRPARERSPLTPIAAGGLSPG